MSEQTKHERFVSEETLEQIANLIKPLSNHLGTPMTLFDADGSIFSQSTYPSPCSFAIQDDGAEESVCRECCERLRNRFRDVYDAPVIEQCDAGVRIIAVPIKAERQLPTRTSKQFIGMLCLNPPSWDNDDSGTQFSQSQIHITLAFIESLLRQIAMRNQDLGELVSQLLEFQNELTMSYRFSSAASDNMDIDSLFQEALELIQNHVRPKEACIVVPSEPTGFEEVVHSSSLPGSRSETSLFSTNIYCRIVEKALQGMPVLINSYNGHSKSESLDTSIKSILAMPIRTGKDVFGAIILAGKENGEMFLADDENFVTSLTNSLGMVLKHVKLVKEVVKAEKSSVMKQQEIVARVVHKMRNQLFAMRGNVRWLD
ncbi:GAF domain-containing protein [Candidatus Poribacteria bacterium]